MDLYIDGATKHNGEISKQKSYVAVTNDKGEALIDEYVGTVSNNQAEVLAVIECLRYIDKHNLSNVTIKSDSRLTVKGVSGEWQIKSDKIAPYIAQARDWMSSTGSKIEWVPRKENLAGVYLERKYAKNWREYWPQPQKRYKSTLSSATQLSIKDWVNWLNRQTNLTHVDEYRIYAWWIKAQYKEGNIAEAHEGLKRQDEVMKFIRSHRIKNYKPF